MNRLAPPIRPASYRDVLDAPVGMVAELIGGGLHLIQRHPNRTRSPRRS